MGTPNDWQVKKRKVSERGRYLLETSQWSDCKFIVGTEPHQETFQCHKLFLAIASPVFDAMFFGGMAEKDVPIPILDVQPEAFRALLEYIYTDGINLQSFDQACELCYAAKKYMLPYLVEECTKFLWRDLHPRNACRAYEFAKLFEEPVLMEKCLEIMCSETQAVLSDPSFEEAEHSTLVTLLEQENLAVTSELILFEAVTRWAGRECQRRGLTPSGENLRTVLGSEPLRLLRLLTLTPSQLASGPAISTLLTRDEAFALLLEASAPRESADLPEGLCTSRVPRYHPKKRGCTMPPRLGKAHPFRKVGLFSGGSPPLESTDHNPMMAMTWGSPSRSHCWRNMIPDAPCYHATGNMEASVTFTVDRNICVVGILVPTQVSERHRHGENPSSSGEHYISELAPRSSELNPSYMHVISSSAVNPYSAQSPQNLSKPRSSGSGPSMSVTAGSSRDTLASDGMFGARIMGFNEEYTELLYAHLTDADGCRLTYTHLSARVQPDSMVEISFNRSVHLTRGRTYKIGVQFTNSGWYPIGECDRTVKCDDVTFNFCVGGSDHYIRDGLIRSIIFTF
ncbi:hypothetical protein J437_LFUL001531 [Ladona fulva]|uniref:BTB domain-containing protein n=1 Tax=Ladona fulva TaxID=123851 RepID=A0A8K0JV58_LADFU|nr:hypothetical protein J437_LFUL001531 [Ladona fulva]